MSDVTCPDCGSNNVYRIGKLWFCNYIDCNRRHSFTPDSAKQADATLDSFSRTDLGGIEKPTYRTLSESFLQLMDEIGEHGFNKHGEASMEAKSRRGDFSRSDRTKSREIAKHAANHFDEYLDGVHHDHFHTREHQLAAAAFNCMIEYMLFKQQR